LPFKLTPCVSFTFHSSHPSFSFSFCFPRRFERCHTRAPKRFTRGCWERALPPLSGVCCHSLIDFGLELILDLSFGPHQVDFTFLSCLFLSCPFLHVHNPSPLPFRYLFALHTPPAANTDVCVCYVCVRNPGRKCSLSGQLHKKSRLRKEDGKGLLE